MAGGRFLVWQVAASLYGRWPLPCMAGGPFPCMAGEPFPCLAGEPFPRLRRRRRVRVCATPAVSCAPRRRVLAADARASRVRRLLLRIAPPPRRRMEPGNPAGWTEAQVIAMPMRHSYPSFNRFNGIGCSVYCSVRLRGDSPQSHFPLTLLTARTNIKLGSNESFSVSAESCTYGLYIYRV